MESAKCRNTFYAVSDCGDNLLYMHRILCPTQNGLVVDHINGDGLDNRKSNLRAVSASINRLSSRIPKNNTTGFKGIIYDKRRGKWYARIHTTINGVAKRLYLGSFYSPQEAHAAHLAFIKEHYGDFFYRAS